MTNWRAENSDREFPRLNILKNATRKGVVIPFNDKQTMPQLRTSIAKALQMDHVEYLFNPHGCEVTDVNLIRDNDVIIASAKPKFEKPGKKKVGETAIYTMLKEALKLILKFAVDMLRKQITEAVASA